MSCASVTHQRLLVSCRKLLVAGSSVEADGLGAMVHDRRPSRHATRLVM
jgi:hypothetical protein